MVEEQSEETKLMECLEYLDDRQPEIMGSAHTVWWCEVSQDIVFVLLRLVFHIVC